MTHQQLVDFFVHAGLPFSRDVPSVRLLRKQLLLELKASEDHRLSINGNLYGTDDVIRLFDAIPENGFGVYQSLPETFPVLERVYALEHVFTPVPVPSGIKDDPRFPDFYRYELEPRLGTYLHLMEASLKQNDLRTVAGLLSFAALFPEEEQYRIFARIILLLRSKLGVILLSLERARFQKARAEEGYFTDRYYYVIVKQVADDDPDFLFDQYRVAEKYMKKDRYKQAVEIIRLQMLLSHGTEVRRVMEINKKRFEGVSSSSGSFGSFYPIVIGVIVVIRIVFWASTSGSHRPVYIHSMPYRNIYDSLLKKAGDTTLAQPGVFPDTLPDSTYR